MKSTGHWKLSHRARLVGVIALLVGGGCALLLQRHTLRDHPAFAEAPTVAQTVDGSPGDALNVALVGKEEQLLQAMRAAGWHPADAVTLKSSLRISVDTVLHRAYDDAPVSTLLVWGRKQDFAFEQPVGPDPRKRHHVRFWRSPQADDQGRPLWLGAGTYDVSVGLSHRTGHITHHISPDIDTERDKIIGDLSQARWISALEWVDDFQPQESGRNGGGDPWRTDRRLAIGSLGEPDGATAKND